MTARTLVLLRHAKAEDPGNLIDFDRSLTPTGRADADAAGAWLADERLHPRLVLCSPAKRTRQTWQAVAISLTQSAPDAPTPEVRFPQSLYDGGRTEVVDLLRSVPDTIHTVLIVGHNPTMSGVSTLLRPHEAGAPEFALRTAGLAVHRADGQWSQTEPGSMPYARGHTARG